MAKPGGMALVLKDRRIAEFESRRRPPHHKLNPRPLSGTRQQRGEAVRSAQQLKSEGQQLALQFNAAWSEQAMALLDRFCRMTGAVPFLFEDFRAYALAQGLPMPTTHKVWGALPRIAVSRGIIRATGEYRATKSPATHGHPAKTWVAA